LKNQPSRPLALVTGASSGLGAEFARQLAARGYNLVLVARREEKLEAVAQQLRERHGTGAEVLVADLAVDRDVEKVAHRIAAEPEFELLVNNAGFGALGYFFEGPLEPQEQMHRVQVQATLRLTHAALAAMVPRGHGGVINVSSVAAFSRIPGHTSYAAVKAWMTAFTECLHLELRMLRSPVRIQALCPGFTHTEFHDVLGMDRDKIASNPNWWMTAEFVVSESLKGLDRGKWLVIPGWRYRMLVRLLGALPRALMHRIMIRVARKREEAAKAPKSREIPTPL